MEGLPKKAYAQGIFTKGFLSRKVNNRNIVWVALTRTLKQFLMIDAVRYLVAYPRYFYFTNIRRKLKAYQDPSSSSHKDTIQYNKRALGSVAVVRSNQLLRPLSIVDPVYKRLEDLKVLSIGPRTEGEILNLFAHGFSLRNIRGLDLISYSPWIDLGDMHKMPYKDSSFDVLINGWCIGYSEKPEEAAKEMVRVAKDGAIIAIGLTYHPPAEKAYTDELLKEKYGETFSTLRQFTSSQELLDLFGKSVGQVFFNQDLTPDGKKNGQSLITIFSVKKAEQND